MLGEEDCCLVWAKAVVAARQKKRTRRNLMACSGMVNDHDYTSAHWSGAASVITAENTESSRLNGFPPWLRGEESLTRLRPDVRTSFRRSSPCCLWPCRTCRLCSIRHLCRSTTSCRPCRHFSPSSGVSSDRKS